MSCKWCGTDHEPRIAEPGGLNVCIDVLRAKLEAESMMRQMSDDLRRDAVIRCESAISMHQMADAKIAQLRDALDLVQWSGARDWTQPTGTSRPVNGLCHNCGRARDQGHGPDCDIGNALAAIFPSDLVAINLYREALEQIAAKPCAWGQVFPNVCQRPKDKGGLCEACIARIALAKIPLPPLDDARRALAQAAHDANAKRNAELEAMTPKDREKAIAEWAKQLAADVADLND